MRHFSGIDLSKTRLKRKALGPSCELLGASRKTNAVALYVLGVLALAPVVLSQPSRGSSRKVLPVIRCQQEHTYWCWAASAQMIMSYHKLPVIKQCEQVKSRYPGPGYPDASAACNPPPITASEDERKKYTDACDLPGWPEFEKWGFQVPSQTTRTGLSWDEIRNEIDNDRPFCFTKEWVNNPGHGHMLVVFGYEEVKGEQFVRVWDPLPGRIKEMNLPYSKYQANVLPSPEDDPEPYFHWNDYYRINPKP